MGASDSTRRRRLEPQNPLPSLGAGIDSRRRAGGPTRRYASLDALSSAASDAPISAFERFAAGRGLSPSPGAAAQGAAAAGAAPKRCAFLLGAAT
jgi:hypothetical protein